MTALLNGVLITTPVTAALGPVMQTGARVGVPNNALLQGKLTYGSGGTTVDAWVQTSIDGGGSWCDVANFHFTTASARFIFNLSSTTVITTQATPTDGTMAANTSSSGLIGPRWRVKYSSTGTYAGTTLEVDMEADQPLTSL